MVMSESFTDGNMSDLTMWNNKSNNKINNSVLSQQLSFNRSDSLEFNAIKNLVTFNYLMDYMPNPDGLSYVTDNFDEKDIYLVQCRNAGFNYSSFGSSVNGRIDINIKEASNVTRYTS